MIRELSVLVDALVAPPNKRPGNATDRVVCLKRDRRRSTVPRNADWISLESQSTILTDRFYFFFCSQSITSIPADASDAMAIDSLRR